MAKNTVPVEAGIQIQPSRLAGQVVGAIVSTFVMFHAVRWVIQRYSRPNANEITASILSFLINILIAAAIVPHTMGNFWLWGLIGYSFCHFTWMLLYLLRARHQGLTQGEDLASGLKSSLAGMMTSIWQELSEAPMKRLFLGSILLGTGLYWIADLFRWGYVGSRWILIVAVPALTIGGYIAFRAFKPGEPPTDT